MSFRTEGSLAFFKAKLQRSDISGKVKGHFKSHMAFLQLVGEQVILAQWRAMLPEIGEIDVMENDDKLDILDEVLDIMLRKYKYVQPVSDHVSTNKDEVFNYFNNLAQWYLHIEALNRMAKEGDITMIVPNLLMCLPFFYKHSTLSKYLVESMNYCITVEYILSPLQKLRVLEGSFVNVRGGPDNNVESDLLQEHSVRNQKMLIRQLGANKTKKAIQRASGAGGAIADIAANVGKSLGIKERSSKHTRTVSQEEKTIVANILNEIKPFEFTPGRKFEGFEKLDETVFQGINVNKMYADFARIIERILAGQVFINDDDDNDDSDFDDNSENDEDDLPDL